MLPTHTSYPSTEHRPTIGHGTGHQYSDSTDDSYELAGTVPRPDTEPLHEMWKHGKDGPTSSPGGMASGGSVLPTVPQYPGGAAVPLRDPEMTLT